MILNNKRDIQFVIFNAVSERIKFLPHPRRSPTRGQSQPASPGHSTVLRMATSSRTVDLKDADGHVWGNWVIERWR
ncbi:MAG: hypothetical protein R3293_13965 [Candidatus Promineifilaceae bacterium]|nr:hypothetical protein [Candidatus Promineifilaceae bacterium]